MSIFTVLVIVLIITPQYIIYVELYMVIQYSCKLYVNQYRDFFIFGQ